MLHEFTVFFVSECECVAILFINTICLTNSIGFLVIVSEDLKKMSDNQVDKKQNDQENDTNKFWESNVPLYLRNILKLRGFDRLDNIINVLM